MKLIYGQGLNDRRRPAKENGKMVKQYMVWIRMLDRCYSGKPKNSAYLDCSVSKNFKSYTYFYDWCLNQTGFGLKDWALDKDLLVKGNREYSENNCVFIPSLINSLLTNRRNHRGLDPIGVHFNKKNNKYQVTVSDFRGNQIHLGFYSDSLTAFNVYKKKKEDIIRCVADEWRGLLDIRAYEALMNYTIDITD